MKHFILSTLLLTASLAIFAGAAAAQDNQPPPPPPEGERMGPPPGGPPPGQQPPDDRGEILRDLNLSQDQFKTIRKLLGENAPKVRAAQQDFRDAQEALDDAIYADSVDETLVQNLTKRSADAQATLMRLRTANEFAIRRVLNPEQVVKFRELRQQQIVRKKAQERMRGQRNGGPPNGRPMDGPPDGRSMRQPGQQGQPGQPGMQPQGQPGNNIQPNQKGKPF
jgi:Spy/CpxP family protein refolding chaperone